MDLAKLSKCGTLRYFEKNNIICIEGQPGSTAYLLLKGSASVRVGSFNDNGRDVATLNVGTIFGEMSLLEDNPRSATVVALEDGTTALEIGKNDFLSFMKTDPVLAYGLLMTLHGRIEHTLDEHKGFLIAYNAQVHRDTTYTMISSLSQDQFTQIVTKDGEYALKLLKSLSHTLADINHKVMDIGKK